MTAAEIAQVIDQFHRSFKENVNKGLLPHNALDAIAGERTRLFNRPWGIA